MNQTATLNLPDNLTLEIDKKKGGSKKWIIADKKPSQELIKFCTGLAKNTDSVNEANNQLLAQILLNRGVKSVGEAQYYLGNNKPAYSSPAEIPQMSMAVQRIKKAIEKKENIVIFGDYDVDGTTSTALLISALNHLGAQTSFYIPNRFTEGYGLNSKAVVSIKAQRKAKLLITCDCGITNIDEVKLAQSIGLDVIVTDHHSLPDILPPAVAVLNPKLLPEEHPLHWLPGVGVAYKLAEALFVEFAKDFEDSKKDEQPKIEYQDFQKALLDFVALGMIADLAPLRAENRLLVQEGLKVLNLTTRPGLRALLGECDYKADEEGVGFAIAPRINAAGRLNDAQSAVKLFLSEDLLEARTIASSLTEQNKFRQDLCDQIYREALQKIENEVNIETARVLMLADTSWNHGVVGIVASRLVEKYHLPVFLAVEEIDEETQEIKIKGSARGILAIDLFEEMSKFAELFTKFGGHKAAAGFSMQKENWEKFKISMQAELNRTLNQENLDATLDIDSALDADNLNLEFLKPIFELAPYGMGFTRPVFTFKDLCILQDVQSLGKTGEHTKLILSTSDGSRYFEAIRWRAHTSSFEIAKGKEVNIAFTANKRVFKQKEYLQLEVKDWYVESLNENCFSTTIKSQIAQDQNQNRVNSQLTPLIEESLIQTNKKPREVKDFLKQLVLQAKEASMLSAIDLIDISTKLSSREETCNVGLNLLAESGLLSVHSLGNNKICISFHGKAHKMNLDTTLLKKHLADEANMI
ncbi:MAG: single-stranded-DNA-specific exonuclease RecJ [Candidatus Melainabacteria bacterium]|jgi:single-stranded-DNA-specific exonuclease